MELLIVSLIGVLFVAVFILLVFAWRQGKQGVDRGAIAGALATSWKELGIDQDIGRIKAMAQEVARSSQDLKRLFEVKRGRAEFGEFQLEEILSDILPRDRFSIRKKRDGLGIPDASIDTKNGIVCIDAKFPLENYRRMLSAESQGDEREAKASRTSFRNDVMRHVEEIADKYVRPDEGSVPYAFAFIPAEAVFQYLSQQDPVLLREAATRGVNLSSPSTLVANLNLIRLGLHVERISEVAERVEQNLRRLRRPFDKALGDWKTLKGHLIHAQQKVPDVESSLEAVHMELDRLAKGESSEAEAKAFGENG